MLLLGLTGSIATGKSSVSNILRSPPYNLPIIDADVIARQVVEPGTAGYKAIVSHFLPSTPELLLPLGDPLSGGKEDGKDGKGRPLNRPALGRRIFGDSPTAQEGRKKLNSIVHPAVRREIFRQIMVNYIKGAWCVVLDIPLLFESGGSWERLCGCVVVVAVSDPDIQLQRLRARDSHLSEEDARNRVGSQGDVREKAARAIARGTGWGEVVWNDEDKGKLASEVERVMRLVRKGTPGWWSWTCLIVPPVGGLAALWTFLKSWKLQKRWDEEKGKERARL
ncbi:CoaE-domain-containing protein [Aulographum hederae CBS 113979]|uniref:CoaE-domain-containing protein n=1 Tax=Aulographum hederae CBS 113979 TaxID=1176131 RepID=A0A6G1HDY2_9PEZI|nr:CoaE-domain-containing protein [Aulographum hederae CBS 113979]